MLDIIKMVVSGAPEYTEHEAKWGGYNDLPPGFTEISEKEFARSDFFMYAFDKRQYRQMMRTTGGASLRRTICGALYFMHDGTGYMIEADWQAGKLKYYRFGCDHMYRSLTKEEVEIHKPTRGRCLHTTICDRCGYVRTVDSSD